MESTFWPKMSKTEYKQASAVIPNSNIKARLFRVIICVKHAAYFINIYGRRRQLWSTLREELTNP